LRCWSLAMDKQRLRACDTIFANRFYIYESSLKHE
jgi:hypothetical protein